MAGAGETTAIVRRKMGSAARAAGHKLTIRRTGDEVYFWVGEAQSRKREAPKRPAQGVQVARQAVFAEGGQNSTSLILLSVRSVRLSSTG